MSHVHRGKSRPAPAPRAHSAPPSPQRRRIMWLLEYHSLEFELQHMINPPGPVAPLPPEVVQAIDQGGAVAVDTGAVKFWHNNWILLPDGRLRVACNQGGSGVEQAAATSRKVHDWDPLLWPWRRRRKIEFVRIPPCLDNCYILNKGEFFEWLMTACMEVDDQES